jgi:sugar phosphate isomerase/epimerase
MSDSTTRPWSRREFLQAGAAVAMAAAVRPAVARAADDPYAGFKMGFQSYSLRGYKAPEALDHTKELGLKYWEGYPGHIPQGSVPKHIEEQRALLASRGVTMLAYGVVDFDADENKARAMFDFAKGMGLLAISANPVKDQATFDLLDKLVAEYDIAIAIHNHGPKARYDKIADVETMVKDRHPKIGACVDTGHYLRSDEEPVEAIERLGKRVFGVHLKDVKTIEKDGQRSKQFKILGEGDLNVLGCLKALKKLNYQNCLAIEYEENPQNPLSDLEVCLKNVRAAAAQL